MSETQKFDSFLLLPAELVPASQQVVKFVSEHIKYDSDDDVTVPNWQDFLTAVTNYNSDDLSFDQFRDETINQSNSTVEEIVARIVAFLLDVIGPKLDNAGTTGLTTTIENALRDLQLSKDNGWANFNQQSSGKSSWEYRLLFSITDPELPGSFYALATTISLRADISEESSWWSLDLDEPKDYSAHVTAMQLVVEKGFNAPDSVL